MNQDIRTWLPALAGMTCLGLGAGLLGLFGFFIEPLAAEFGVGVARLNVAPVLFLLVPGLIAPFVGRLVDRVPIRRMLLGGSAWAMISLYLVSRAPTLSLAGAGLFSFAIGFVFYGPLVVNGLMVKLYPGRQGTALAVVALGTSVSAITLPPIVGAALQWLDWRTTLASMAVAMLALLWAWILVAIPADAGATVESARQPVARDIYRRREFWLVGIALALAINVAIILTICYPPLLSQRGYTAVEAGLFLSVGGIGGVFGKLVIAGTADALRLHARVLAAALLSLKLLGLTLLLNAQSTPWVIAAVAIMGCSGGALLPMHAYLNSRYFEADIIGQVNGAQVPLFLPLGLIGPPLAGYVFDRTGGYELVLASLIAIQLAALTLVLLLPRSRL